MLPNHNAERLWELVEELAELRYSVVSDIESFERYEDDGAVANSAPAGNHETVGQGYRWKAYDRFCWLTTEVTLPCKKDGMKVLGYFDFGGRRGGNTSHFESLLYVNGEPYQGVDGNHREVFFPGMEGQKVKLEFRVWSGRNGGGRPQEMLLEIKRAQTGFLNDAADKFYFLSRSMLETHRILEESSPVKEWLLNLVNSAFRKIDYTHVRTDHFYETVAEALKVVEDGLAEHGKAEEVSVSLIGHTHIDVAWLWTLKDTREKAARSFSTVNRLMDQNEDYVFLQSQAQLYDYIKHDYPKIYEMIKRRVAEGRWEPSGAMWVECDCNLASGESIVRQILLGKNFFNEEFNYESEFLWLPDVFGYSAAMPQILKKSGVNTFITSKISWNDTNTMPNDTFIWRGIDGSEVLSQFITTPDQGAARYHTYNGDTRPYAVKGTWDNYANKGLNHELFSPYGFGDGGGGPTRDMIETKNAVRKIPGLPMIKSESMTEYLHRLHETIEKNPLDGRIPLWDGELYLEFHRGTYTSQAYNKRMNRKLEYMLKNTELLSVIAMLGGGNYQKDRLKEIWKVVLCNQFHDILPGSSIREVYEDCIRDYTACENELRSINSELSRELFNGEGYTVFNCASFDRDTIMQLPQELCGHRLVDASGREIVTGVADGREYALLEGLLQTGFCHIRADEQESSTDAAKSSECSGAGSAESGFYVVEWDNTGALTRIYDKENDREVLKKGGKGNLLTVFEDKPRCFDAWELDEFIDDKPEQVKELGSVKLEKNRLGSFVTFTWKYDCSEIKQTMMLYEKKRRIDFKTEVEWAQHQKLMKASFDVDIRATDARFDIQYGNISRSVTRNHSWEAARFEVVAHKWMDMGETGYGVSILNDCKYGHDVRDGVMRITLLKSGIEPDYDADQGHHEFTYSLLPHVGAWFEAGVEKEAADLNDSVILFKGSSGHQGSIIDIGQAPLMVDCVKLAEDGGGIIVRMHEYGGSRGKTRMRTSFNVKSWLSCDLMERPLEEDRTDTIELNYTPYEVITLRIHI